VRNIFIQKTIPVRWHLGVAIVAVALVLFAGVAVAAGDSHESGESVLKLLIYQSFNLALLLGVLIYFGRKPVSEFFSTRRSGIQSELSEAADLLAQAEQRNSELQRRLVDLGSEIEGIQEEAGRRAEEEAERILADARATADRIRRDAQAAVAQELRRAQSELREEAADLALEIAAQKLNEQVGEADRDRLVDEFILRVEANAGEGADL
jgi:F-type H+-transporting ATPase subunit b